MKINGMRVIKSPTATANNNKQDGIGWWGGHTYWAALRGWVCYYCSCLLLC